jgi:Protein of unknown function (DUF2586)
MALGGVFITDTDGNIGTSTTNNTERVSGLLFDISAQSAIWESGVGATLADKLKNTVVELNSLDDVEELGIPAFTGVADKDFLAGVPYYHINHFFKVAGGSGRLFVAFADCSTNWNAIIDMQKAANGLISQFGVWTEKSLWKEVDAKAETYAIQHTADLQIVATTLANEYHAPTVILLNANAAKVTTANGTSDVVFNKIPSCIENNRYVSVLLGQSAEDEVAAMQAQLTSVTPVGNIGAAIGCLAISNVSINIGYVANHNVGTYFPEIEFGFGNTTLKDGKITDATNYKSLTNKQLDALVTKGYNILTKYAGLEGNTYFSGDQTCSDGDFRRLALNRIINKANRGIRAALLPYVNAPIKVDPSTGNLSAAQSTVFKNLVNTVLTNMVTDEEISGIGAVNVPVAQNILQNDTLSLSYSVIPMGTSSTINVTASFALKQ